MSGPIINCKRCNVVFRKTISEQCPSCAAKENEEFQRLFRTLQDSRSKGGIVIEDLSQLIGLSLEEIESYYLEGKLGTAGIFLKFECKNCKMLMSEMNRKGRYCVNCSESVSEEAGVQVKSRQQLDKDEEESKRRQAEAKQLEMARAYRQRNQAEPRRDPRAGFIRNR